MNLFIFKIQSYFYYIYFKLFSIIYFNFFTELFYSIIFIFVFFTLLYLLLVLNYYKYYINEYIFYTNLIDKFVLKLNKSNLNLTSSTLLKFIFYFFYIVEILLKSIIIFLILFIFYNKLFITLPLTVKNFIYVSNIFKTKNNLKLYSEKHKTNLNSNNYYYPDLNYYSKKKITKSLNFKKVKIKNLNEYLINFNTLKNLNFNLFNYTN